MHGSKVKITGADFPSAGKSCRIGGKETVPIPVKIRSNNRRNRCGKRHGRNRTNTKPSPPPLGSPAEKSERTDGEKKRRGARGAGVKTRHCAPGYLERRVLTIVHNYERGAVPNKKYYSSEV